MANIKFILNNGKNTEEGVNYSIYIRYRFGRKVDIRKAIGFKVRPEDWNMEKEEVRNKIHLKNRGKINNLIKNLKRYIEDFESDLLERGEEPSKHTTAVSFNMFFNKPKKSKIVTFFEYIKDFQNRPDVRKNKTKGTLKNYLITENKLKKFHEEVYPIDFKNINMDFYNDFVDWCEEEGLSKNYIGKLIQTLKTFLNSATNDKVNTTLEYQNPRFKVQKEEVENVYLSLNELEKIYKLDLSNHPRMDLARDLFIIGAYTGLRVCNFNYLTKENIFEYNEKTYLKLTAKKSRTFKELVIPLRPEVLAIFQKHGNKPPKRMPDQKINYKIKEVCENAGIDETVVIKKTRGGKKLEEKYLKYDLVKTHTARRSFCTNAYLSGMTAFDIMQISGHTSEKTFLKYIKANSLQKAEKISEHPFFKGNNNK